jgi:hypothetical protein
LWHFKQQFKKFIFSYLILGFGAVYAFLEFDDERDAEVNRLEFLNVQRGDCCSLNVLLLNFNFQGRAQGREWQGLVWRLDGGRVCQGQRRSS